MPNTDWTAETDRAIYSWARVRDSATWAGLYASGREACRGLASSRPVLTEPSAAPVSVGCSTTEPPCRDGPRRAPQAGRRRAWARRNAARGQRSWRMPGIGRGARSPSTSRVPRRMKSPWFTPHSRSDLSASSPDASHRRQRLRVGQIGCRTGAPGVELIAPHRRTRTRRTQDGRPLRRYRRRWKVERLFAWLQNFRRIVVRYERFAENFLGMLHLACCLILLRGL